MITVHNNIEEYTHEEKLALEQAFKDLEVKAQGGNLTLDETRIRVAHVRLKREENFKIAQPAKTKVTRKPKEESLEDALAGLSGEVKPKRTRAKKLPVIKEDKLSNIARLYYRQQQGEVLTSEELELLNIALAPPEVL